MILNQLILRNFCLYGGQQVLDLTPAQRAGRPAPIVLFGGTNGGGKTTLLDAVQLVLYGNRARCSKRADKGYDQFLRESIHHGADGSKGASIELAFRYASEGQDRLYTVTRAWSVAGGRVREKVRVCRDGKSEGWLSETDWIPTRIRSIANSACTCIAASATWPPRTRSAGLGIWCKWQFEGTGGNQIVGRNKSAQFRQEFPRFFGRLFVPELRGLVPAYLSL